MLHLRGNVVGYLEAGTPNKWLYFISGRSVDATPGPSKSLMQQLRQRTILHRHDLPFYLPHYVELQKSC
jgi:hypothetical protein